MTTVCDLTDKHCVACEGGIAALNEKEIADFLKQVKGWALNSAPEIVKEFHFKDFYQVMAFVNAVAWIANQENHHPDIALGYNYCTVRYSTHAVKGITENDFICAAKLDALTVIG